MKRPINKRRKRPTNYHFSGQALREFYASVLEIQVSPRSFIAVHLYRSVDKEGKEDFFVDIRLWYPGEEGKLYPTAKGIRVSLAFAGAIGKRLVHLHNRYSKIPDLPRKSLSLPNRADTGGNLV